MQETDNGRLRAVVWTDVLPWLILARCFRIAISFRLLVLSAIGTLAMLSGWTFFALLFASDPQIAKQLDWCRACPWRAITEQVPDSPPLWRAGTGFFVPPAPLAELSLPTAASAAEEPLVPRGLGEMVQQPQSVLQRKPEPFWGSWLYLTRPFAEVFSSGVPVERVAFLVLCGLWGVAFGHSSARASPGLLPCAWLPASGSAGG